MVRIVAVVATALSVPLLFAFAGVGNDDQPSGDVSVVNPEGAPGWQLTGIQRDHARAATALQANEAAFEYTVQPGDTIWAIARLFDVSTAQLREVNDTRGAHIVPGDRLAVPLTTPGDLPDGTDAATEAVLREVEAEYDLPSGLLLALAWQESRWRQDGVSSAGAIGITQILPTTADWAHEVLFHHELNWRESAYDNARMGAAYLQYLLQRADGDVWVALAAYYQGWNGLQKYGPYGETQRYVASVLALVPRFQ